MFLSDPLLPTHPGLLKCHLVMKSKYSLHLQQCPRLRCGDVPEILLHLQ